MIGSNVAPQNDSAIFQYSEPTKKCCDKYKCLLFQTKFCHFVLLLFCSFPAVIQPNPIPYKMQKNIVWEKTSQIFSNCSGFKVKPAEITCTASSEYSEQWSCEKVTFQSASSTSWMARHLTTRKEVPGPAKVREWGPGSRPLFPGQSRLSSWGWDFFSEVKS